MTLIALSMLAGIMTVASPCVLPVLPVVFGSATGDGADPRRQMIVLSSLTASIVIFTLLLKTSSLLMGVSDLTLRVISGLIIIGVGLAWVIPEWWANVAMFSGLERRATSLLARANATSPPGYTYPSRKYFPSRKYVSMHRAPPSPRPGWVSAVLTGVALGPVFTSCSPIYAYLLAVVIPTSFGFGLLCLISYVAALCGLLYLVIRLGSRVVKFLSPVANPSGWPRRIAGILFVFVGLAIMSGQLGIVEAWLVGHNPFDISNIEISLVPR